MEEIDIWRAADVLRKQYGEDAAIMASMRADQLLDEGDMQGCTVMRRVVAAINDLDRNAPAQGEKTH